MRADVDPRERLRVVRRGPVVPPPDASLDLVAVEIEIPLAYVVELREEARPCVAERFGLASSRAGSVAFIARARAGQFPASRCSIEIGGCA